MNSDPTTNENVRSFCAFCGKPIIPNAKFCSYCGKEQVAISASPSQPVSSQSVSTIEKPVTKRTRKGTLFLVLSIIFTVAAIIVLLLMKLIKFRTDHLEIIAFRGSPRSTINHDLPLYYLWFGGWILASAFILAAVVCVIKFGIAKKSYVYGIFTFFIIFLCVIPLYGESIDKLSDNIENYKIVKILDGKNTSDDFIPYNYSKDR